MDISSSRLVLLLVLLGAAILGIRYVAGLVRITEEDPRRREATMLKLLLITILVFAVFLILIECTVLQACQF